MEINQADNELIKAATDLIIQRYSYGKQHVGAAIRAKSGKIFTAVNVDTYVGRAGVCAEAIAIGKMISEGELEFSSIVAVFHPRPDSPEDVPYVASPCGVCREMIIDYSPEAEVIFMENNKVTKAKAHELLPHKFTKRHLPRN